MRVSPKVPRFRYCGPVAGLMPALLAAAAVLAAQTATPNK